MNRFTLALSLALAMSVSAFGQVKFKPTEEIEIDRQEVANLENENARAIQNHDTTYFKRVYGDDFLGVTPAGLAITKPGLLFFIQSFINRYDSVKIDDLNIRLFGDFAVVTCRRTERGALNGQPFVRQFRVIHVYINGQRGWKVVSGQETLVAPRETAH